MSGCTFVMLMHCARPGDRIANRCKMPSDVLDHDMARMADAAVLGGARAMVAS